MCKCQYRKMKKKWLLLQLPTTSECTSHVCPRLDSRNIWSDCSTARSHCVLNMNINNIKHKMSCRSTQLHMWVIRGSISLHVTQIFESAELKFHPITSVPDIWCWIMSRKVISWKPLLEKEEYAYFRILSHKITRIFICGSTLRCENSLCSGVWEKYYPKSFGFIWHCFLLLFFKKIFKI